MVLGNNLQLLLILYFISFSQSLLPNEASKESSQEFRGVWVSPWGGDADLVTFISKEKFIQKMRYIKIL